MNLEVNKVYRSPVGAPVRLIALVPERLVFRYPVCAENLLARVEYVNAENQKVIGWLYASDLEEWADAS